MAIKRAFHIILLLTAALCACVTDNEPSGSFALKPGDHMPQFSVKLADGSTITSANLLGAPAMIVLFNTSCPDCRKELPVVNSVAKATGVRTICIARQEDAASIASFWEAENLSVPYSPQPDRKVFELFASETIPRIFLFNASSVVTHTFTDNPLPSAETLLNAISHLQ